MLLRPTLLAGLVLAAFALPAIAQDDGILVYNAQHENLTQAWADAFTAETGIKVTLRQGSDLEVGNQILQEGANSPADVFLTENSPAMVLVDNAGLFEPLPQDILEPIIAKQDSDAQPIIWIAMNSDRNTPLELTTIAERQIKPRFQGVPGV